MSSSWLPLSITFPFSTTKIQSAFRTVDKRCATITTVMDLVGSPSRLLWPLIISSIASCTRASLSASNADVASSSSKILGFRTRALAMATRCFCPPLS
mmetsp:Transcript_11579/g.19601  ORF Transcript_11579/g.19601 Transcript_11579/m.19601 type:complete len:98 (+) Transcript_11579:142-435(+)